MGAATILNGQTDHQEENTEQNQATEETLKQQKDENIKGTSIRTDLLTEPKKESSIEKKDIAEQDFDVNNCEGGDETPGNNEMNKKKEENTSIDNSDKANINGTVKDDD